MINKKNTIRKYIKQYFSSCEGLEAVSKVETLQKSYKYCKAFLNAIPAYKNAKTIFAYYPLPKEFPTHGLLHCAYNDKKTIGLPIVKDNNLIFKKIAFNNEKIDTMTEGAFGILEPCEAAPILFSPFDDFNSFLLDLPLLILVPGRAFSLNGERMGRGGGFYDRFFEKLFRVVNKNDVNLVGICFSGQVLEKIPMERFDYYVDSIITERTISTNIEDFI